MTEQGSSGQRPLTSQSQAFTNANQLSMATGPSMSGAGDGLDSLAPIFPPAGFDVPDISFSNSVIPNADFNSSMLNSSSQMFASPGVQYADAPSASAGAGQAQKNYFPPSSNSPPGTSSSDDSDDLPLAQLAKRGLVAGTGVGSPSGLGTDTTSLENSPISNTKKAKTAKRKKKKDPNEPQKPVSAYALFFRDTQATIKGHNPNASFGDVSKIVASMWDQLDPEHKDVYKKKTETAKKQYLKQLAAYRASQVSQSAMDESESSLSPPSAMTPTGATVMSPMQHSGAVSQPGVHIPVTVPSQMIQQQQQQQMMQHHMVQEQQMHQMQQHFPQHQMIIGQQGTPSSPQQQQHSPPQTQGSPPAQVYSSPPHTNQALVNSYQHPVMDNNMYGGYSAPPTEMDPNYPHCVRSGCGNYAKENPSWDSEYCSNDCVISHCRDIFTKWVASRTDSNSFPVK